MAWRGAWVLVVLLAMLPLVAADDLVSQGPFTLTLDQPVRSFTAQVAPGATYKQVTLDFDMTVPRWRDDLPPEQAQWFYPVVGIRKIRPGNGCDQVKDCLLLGLTVKKGGYQGSKPRSILESRYGSTPDLKQDWAGWAAGKTYHGTLTVDGEAKQATLRVNEGGQTHTMTYPIPALSPQDMAQGFEVSFGVDRDYDAAYFRLPGWEFRNVRMQGTQGTFAPGTGNGSNTTPLGPPVLLKQIDGVFFNVTEQQPRFEIKNIANDTPYRQVIVEFDMEFSQWRTDAPSGAHEYFLVHLFSTPGGVPKPDPRENDGFWLSGFTIRGTDGARKTALDPYGGSEPVPTKSTPWVPGKYHIKMISDTDSVQEILEITKDGRPFESFSGDMLVRANSQPLSVAFSDGLWLSFGIRQDVHEYHLVPKGFVFSNLKVSAVPGVPVDDPMGPQSGTQPLTLKQAAGYEPNEEGDGAAVTLLRREGDFFTQPFGVTCAQPGPGCAAELSIPIPPQAGQAYEKITASFEFTTHDLLPAGYFQHMFSLRDACSGNHFVNLAIKQANGAQQAKTVLDSRGSPELLAGDLNYSENTRYRAEVTLDFLDEEAYVRVYSANGTLLHVVGSRINTDPRNNASAEATLDGMVAVFGMYRTFRNHIYGQPHSWKFSNLTVTGVPIGAGSSPTQGGPGGADLGSDEGRLAFLAANLLTIPDGDDYTLECGPAREVLNTPPSQQGGEAYCVLQHDGKVVFATFGESEQEVLESFKDVAFESHINGSDVREEACDAIDSTRLQFQECRNAIRGMHVYAMADVRSQTSFMVVSADTIGAFDTGLFDSLVGFFRRLFGVEEGSGSASVGTLPLRRFHHGYFSHMVGKEVVATWLDSSAVLIYRDFATNFSASRPQGAQYALGRDNQVLRMSLNPTSQADVRTWRRMTAALRLQAVDGTPLQGDRCGNGVIGYEEQCEPGIPVGTCSDLYPLLSGNGTPTCYPAGHPQECTVNVSSCFGARSGTCYDTWVPPPTPHPCLPGSMDPACPPPPSGGGGGGGGCSPACTAGQVCQSGACVNQNATNATCPTPEQKIAEQGAYDLYVRSGPDGKPQLRVQYVRSIGGDKYQACYRMGLGKDSELGDIYLNSGWVGHRVGEISELYRRWREGDDGGRNDIKIIARGLETGWLITGTREGVSARNDYGPGHQCWACPAGSNVFCEELHVEINITGLQQCNPGAARPPGNTTPGTTCERNEDCQEGFVCRAGGDGTLRCLVDWDRPCPGCGLEPPEQR